MRMVVRCKAVSALLETIKSSCFSIPQVATNMDIAMDSQKTGYTNGLGKVKLEL